METFLKILGWLWLIVWNALYLLVVLYVLDRLQGRTEHIVVSILGLIYVSARGHAIAHGIAMSRQALALDEEFTRIRGLLNDETLLAHKSEMVPLRELADRNYWKAITAAIFLSVISLVCLLNLFSHL